VKQFSTEPKKGLKFWNPKPGEEVFFRVVSMGKNLDSLLPDLGHGGDILCTSQRTFETAHQCFACQAHTGVFVAALMTLFLEGPEAARCYYRDRSRS